MIKMRTLFFAVILMLGIGTACTTDNGNEPIKPVVPKHPRLEISNESIWTVHRVSLVGYDFKLLDIRENESRVFTLNEGIPGGNDNVKVRIAVGGNGPVSPVYIINTNVDFVDGRTKTITVLSASKVEVQ